MRRSGFTFLEVLVASALVLLISYCGLQTLEVLAQRDKEEQLRLVLLEMRGALDRFHFDQGRFPETFHELLTAPRLLGAFYLRRFPINPMFGETRWEIASETTLEGTDDEWLEITDPATPIPNGRIIDVRCPPAAGTGLNGVPYRVW